MTKKFFFARLFCCCFWIRDPRFGIRDPGSGMGKNQDPGSGLRDKHPGSATMVQCETNSQYRTLLKKYNTLGLT